MPSIYTIITSIFIVLMIIVYFICPKHYRRSNALPTVMTSLGILGTFVGICLGLWKFDVSDIQASIPTLLAGLKIAFITSIAGIIAAITIKLKNIYRNRNESTEDSGTEYAEHLLKTLDSIRDEQKSSKENLESKLDKIVLSLVGDGESTLITQLQKIRTTMIDQSDRQVETVQNNFDLLKEDLDKFAAQLAENNIKVFIEALEGAIKDFNQKISEQFGENFKQLNLAVGQLLDWQKQYREQMIELIDSFSQSSESLSTSSKNLKDIAEELASASELMDDLDTFVEATKLHIEKLNASLEAHAELAEQAKDAFPTIKSGLDELTGKFLEYVQEVKKQSDYQTSQLKQTVAEQSVLMGEQITSFGNSASKTIQKMDQRVEEHLRKNTDLIANQIQQLDRELEKELNNALQTLGSQLASLSNKFVEDYEPLTEKLREIVRLAEGDVNVS